MEKISQEVDTFVETYRTNTQLKISDEMCIYAEELRNKGISLQGIQLFFEEKFGIKVDPSTIHRRLRNRAKEDNKNKSDSEIKTTQDFFDYIENIQKEEQTTLSIEGQVNVNKSLTLEKRTYIGFEKKRPLYMSKDQNINQKVNILEYQIEYGKLKSYNEIPSIIWNNYLARYEHNRDIAKYLALNDSIFRISNKDILYFTLIYIDDLLINRSPVHIVGI